MNADCKVVFTAEARRREEGKTLPLMTLITLINTRFKSSLDRLRPTRMKEVVARNKRECRKVHVHMIFTPLRDVNQEPFTFEEILGGIKGASVHSVNKALKRSGQLWQDESFDHVIRSSESLNEKVEYVMQNPVRKGLVSRPEDYKWLWRKG